MKSARQIKILEIVSSKDIKTQNQLIEELDSAGFSSTQATISRDIKQLHLVKELTSDGTYKYTYTPTFDVSDISYSERLSTIFKESVTDIDIALNIVVLKTLPGLAPAACSAIDAMQIPDIVGSLAGDDTAFLAVRSNDAAVRICEELGSLL